MRAFFEISSFNLYIQIAVTIISISVHLFNICNANRKGTVIEIITIYVIGLSGWFGFMSGLFGHILYADEVATSIGRPLNSGFQMELGFHRHGAGWLPRFLEQGILASVHQHEVHFWLGSRVTSYPAHDAA